MELDTLPGYVLAFVVDPLYGLPKPVTVGIWRLGDYNPAGQIPKEYELFLGTGEGFNNWRHKFDENEDSIGVVVRELLVKHQLGLAHMENRVKNIENALEFLKQSVEPKK